MEGSWAISEEEKCKLIAKLKDGVRILGERERQMPDLVNKVVFEIPPTLRVLNGLPLPDNLKVIFSPFAKGTVVLLDEAGGWILAKVNKQATFLKGADLVNFLEAQGYLRLELSHMGENYFRVTPSREVPEHNLEQTATQLSLKFMVEGQDSTASRTLFGKSCFPYCGRCASSREY